MVNTIQKGGLHVLLYKSLTFHALKTLLKGPNIINPTKYNKKLEQQSIYQSSDSIWLKKLYLQLKK